MNWVNKLALGTLLGFATASLATAAYSKSSPPPPPLPAGCSDFLGAMVCPQPVTLPMRTGSLPGDYYGSIRASTTSRLSTPDKRSPFIQALRNLIGAKKSSSVKVEMELILASNGAGIRSLGKYNLVAFNLDDDKVSNLSGQTNALSPTPITQDVSLRGGTAILVVLRTTYADSQSISLANLLSNAPTLAAGLAPSGLITAITPPVTAAANFLTTNTANGSTRTVEYDTTINFAPGIQNRVVFTIPGSDNSPSFELVLEPTLKPSLTGVTDPVSQHGDVSNPENNIFLSDNGQKSLSQYLKDHGVADKEFSLTPTTIDPKASDAGQKLAASVDSACQSLLDTLVGVALLNDYDAEAVMHSRVQKASLSAEALQAPCITERNKPAGIWAKFGFSHIDPPPPPIPNVTVSLETVRDSLDGLAVALSQPTASRRQLIDLLVSADNFRLTAPPSLTPTDAANLQPIAGGKQAASVGTGWLAQIHSCALGAYFPQTGRAPSQMSFLMLTEGSADVLVGTATFDRRSDGGLKIVQLDIIPAVRNADSIQTPTGQKVDYSGTAFASNDRVKALLKTGAAASCS